MNVLGFDIETTGLNKHTDNVIELAFVLWNVEEKKPITINSFLLYEKAIPKKIEQLTGITQFMLDNFSVSKTTAAATFHKNALHADAYIAHNGINFDMPFMQRLFRVEGMQWKDMPIIDTRTDLPFPQEVSSRKMQDIAAVHGVINPFEHRALTDTLVMLKILSQYNVPEIMETITVSPFVTITANKYPGDGFWSWKEEKCYRRMARKTFADKEVEILRKKKPDIKFEIVSQ